jgi:hypothetical protein
MIVSLFVSAFLLATPPAPAEDPLVVANQILTAGAALFDKHDAAAMAATYVENGAVELYIKDRDSDTYKRDLYSGRAAIQEGYAKVFKDATPSMKSRNVVDSARFIAPTVLLIQGTFQPDTNKVDTIPFVQVRARDGGDWKILSMQLYALPKD